jgi:hypothetical protein
MRWGRLLAFVALFNFAGAQWIVLQSIAWSAMLLKQARATPLSLAVQKTFDGAHPCQLCKGIAQAKTGETKSPIPVELGKIPLLRANAEMFAVFSHVSSAIAPFAQVVPVRFERPQSPPPRGSLA